MPPSPRLEVLISETKYNNVCAALDITPPTYSVHKSTRTLKGGVAYGDYNRATNHVRIFLGGIDQYEYDRLLSATNELTRTLLHELRHAWQQQHRTDIYDNHFAAETDAERWACQNLPVYQGIVRLKRTFPNSGFSRLSRHATR